MPKPQRVRATVTLKFPESLPDEIVKMKILSHAPSGIEKRTAIWTRKDGDVTGTLTVELEIRKEDADALMNIVDEDWVDDGMVLVMPVNATYESQCVMAKKEKKAPEWSGFARKDSQPETGSSS